MSTTAAELTWVDSVPPALAADVGIAAAATAVDGTAPLSEQVLRHLRGPDAAHLLARDPAGTSSGTPSSDAAATTPDGAPDPVAELVVHPGHRRRGVGSALLAALLERAPQVQVWAHGALPAAAALAAYAGLTAQRRLWRMRRGLDRPLPEPQVPDGVRIRPFAVGADEPSCSGQQRRVLLASRAGRLDPRRRHRAREAEPWFDPAGVLLAVDGRHPGTSSASTGPRCTPRAPTRPTRTHPSARSTCWASTPPPAAAGSGRR